ncbi:F-box protein CPR1 [Linum perenne]
MSDYIPTEILTNILERITGVEDLVRCRRVSKRWLSIIDSPDFIQRHLHRSSQFPLTANSKLGLFVQIGQSCVLYRPENTPRRRYLGSVNLIGTCNGLICFQVNSEPKPQILNPSTGERRYFNTFSSRQIGSDPLLNKYGFGYDQLSDDYKLVVIRGGKVEFHCLRARKRRTIEFQFGDLIPEPKGVLACGALHWGAPGFDCRYGLYSFGVIFGCLCIICVQNGERVQLLRMKEYGNRDTWYRICNTDFGRVIRSISLVGSSSSGRILFLLNGTELLWFHPIPEEADPEEAEDEAMELEEFPDLLLGGIPRSAFLRPLNFTAGATIGLKVADAKTE